MVKPEVLKRGVRFSTRISLFFFLLIAISLIIIALIDVWIGFDPIYYGQSEELPLLVPTIFILPILEEFSFRLFLSKKPIDIHIGMSFFVSYIMTITIIGNFDFGYLLSFLIFFGISALIYLVLKNYPQTFTSLIQLRTNILVVLSSSTFAYAHFIQTDPLILFSERSVYLLPFFFRALVYSKARIKYGISYSITLHILFNLFVYTLMTFK